MMIAHNETDDMVTNENTYNKAQTSLTSLGNTHINKKNESPSCKVWRLNTDHTKAGKRGINCYRNGFIYGKQIFADPIEESAWRGDIE